MFLQHTNAGKPVEPFFLVVATAGEQYVPGEVLTVSEAGTATKCTGTVMPIFICQETRKADEGDVVHVTLVNDLQELEVPLSAAGTALKVGNAVTIGSDGLSVTATTTGGVFLITEILGTEIGDTVRGYFRPVQGS